MWLNLEKVVVCAISRLHVKLPTLRPPLPPSTLVSISGFGGSAVLQPATNLDPDKVSAESEGARRESNGDGAAHRCGGRSSRAKAPRYLAALTVALATALSSHAAMSRGFNRLLEAVVRIDVRELSFDEGTQRFNSGIGSGVVIGRDGLILTNAHVVSPQ